jgi:FkbM family methyltransferase
MLNTGRKMGRALLRGWSRWGKAPGWHYRAVERWGPRLSMDKLIRCVLINGCHMHCDLQDHIQRQIYFLGLYEPIEAYLFTRLLQPGMTVIDGGANVGQYTLLASRAVGPTGAVYSFEPVPATFRRLQAHVADNMLANVHLTCAALWHTSTVLQLGLAPDMCNNCGAYSVGVQNPETTLQCRSLSLDQLMAERRIDRVDVVKLDIEGAELHALRGMLGTLSHHRPMLLMEVNRLAVSRLGYSLGDLWDLLIKDLGYRAWAIGHSCRVCHALAHLDDIKQQNVLFHAADLPAAVTEGWDLKSVLRWARGLQACSEGMSLPGLRNDC